MEFNSIEETIIKKAISDSGWIVNSVKDNMEYVCSNSYFPELVIIKKLSKQTFGLYFFHKIKSEEFLKVSKNIPKEDDYYIFTTENSWTLTVLLKRAAELYSSLPDNPLEQYKKKLETISNAEIEKTEAERLIRERVGQDVYRNALLKYWNGACSVTGCTLKAALRASHAKPWKDCTSDAERLNVFNGFLLTANLDALFDKGYISFTDEGLIMVSSVLNYSDFRGLGINSELKLRWIEESHLEFLKYHREHIWKN